MFVICQVQWQLFKLHCSDARRFVEHIFQMDRDEDKLNLNKVLIDNEIKQSEPHQNINFIFCV